MDAGRVESQTMNAPFRMHWLVKDFLSDPFLVQKERSGSERGGVCLLSDSLSVVLWTECL